MTYQAIADRLGVTWQAVQQSLRLSGNPRSVPITCRKCKTVITRMRMVSKTDGPVYCMTCLPREASANASKPAGSPLD
jgi:hypothetical protein